MCSWTMSDEGKKFLRPPANMDELWDYSLGKLCKVDQPFDVLVKYCKSGRDAAILYREKFVHTLAAMAAIPEGCTQEDIEHTIRALYNDESLKIEIGEPTAEDLENEKLAIGEDQKILMRKRPFIINSTRG